jgi:transketolase
MEPPERKNLTAAQNREIATAIRKDIIRSLAEAGSGHAGGSLGLADVFTALYFGWLRYDPQNPGWEGRDRLILSIGHVAPVLYATLAHAGYFDPAELMTLRKLGSRLQGHPGREHGLPGLELSAGSLGQGLSVAVGLALAGKIDATPWRVVSICGDGELQEGSVWEAAMSAAHHKLDNLVVLVDRNMLQIDGSTSEVMEIEPLARKWEAFGWHVANCDGHSHAAIISALDAAMQAAGKPSVIIAKTKMGKGVASIENNHRWHGRAPSAEEASLFLKELEQS